MQQQAAKPSQQGNSSKCPILITLLSCGLLIVLFAYGTLINQAFHLQKRTDFTTFYASWHYYQELGNPYLLQNWRDYDFKKASGKIVVKEATNKDIQAAPWQVKLNLNPPIFTVATMPFILLSYHYASLAWYLVSFICFLIGIKFFLKSTNNTELISKLSIVTVCLLYYPAISNMIYGQVGFILFLLISLGFYFGLQNKNNAMALSLGIATAIKLFPGLFVFYFLCQKRWQALTVFLGTVIILSVIPLLFLPSTVYLSYLHNAELAAWFAVRLQSFLNGSLLGELLRLKQFGLIVLSNSQIYYLAASLAGLLIFYFCWQCWLLRKNEIAQSFPFLFSLSLISMLLITPLSWDYYAVLLLIPFVLLFRQAKKIESMQLIIMLSLIVLLSSFKLPLDLSQMQDTLSIGKQNTLMLLSHGYCVSLILLFLVIHALHPKLMLNEPHPAAHGLKLNKYTYALFFIVAFFNSILLLIQNYWLVLVLSGLTIVFLFYSRNKNGLYCIKKN